MAQLDETMDMELAVPYLDAPVGSPLLCENLIPDYDDGQFDNNASEYESAEEQYGRYVSTPFVSSSLVAEASGSSQAPDLDTLAMPPPAPGVRIRTGTLPRLRHDSILEKCREFEFIDLDDV